MTAVPPDADPPAPPAAGGTGRVSRRRLLVTGAATAVGGAAAVAVGGGVAVADRQDRAVRAAVAQAEAAAQDRMASFVGADSVPFHGAHQAGVATPAQAHIALCAFDLRPEVGVKGVRALLRILTDDLRRITAGEPALGDTAPELAATPARLTVTVGFGPGVFDRIGRADARPAGLVELPAFPSIDRLEDRYSGGDVILQICADDQITVAHTQRMLFKDTRAFASTRWVQRGFLRARGSGPAGSTPRNLMGQVDGTVNPTTDTDFDSLVWHAGDDWFAGGTTMVVRRIRMGMDAWDELDRSAMEAAVGRRLSNGAPLTGTAEHDPVDLDATDATGLKAIADFAHIRLARGNGTAPQILRRPFNFDDSPDSLGASDVGQLFCSFQADIGRQFVPMQQRMAEGDLLNQWITPVGSAVFAILPGCQPGGFLGEGLFS